MNTKIRIHIFSFLFTAIVYGQNAVHNYGNIQIHDTGLVGFHMDVINDGAFNQNLGLVGFYNTDNTITLSGTSNPVFYDAEIAVDNGFYLENTMGVLNNLNFIAGTIFTPRTASETNLSFLSNSFYIGESDNTKIDGYASIQGKQSFTFPLGMDDRLRPLVLESNAINDYAKSAYFYEDPNSPVYFGTSFDTNAVEDEFLSVSNYEFWHLDGEIPSRITLSWDDESFVSLLAEFTSDLKVVGWSFAERRWVNLGNTNVEGDLDNGTVTSEEFIPNEYAVLTIGGNNDLLETLENIELDNYYMTPNGDGINDFLVIEGIENSPNNTLQIFNRYGILVYSKQGYDNSFDGIANVTSVLSRNKGLASGIYFYIVTLNDIKKKHQGYLYLTSYTQN